MRLIMDMKDYFLGYDIVFENRSEISFNSTIPLESEWKPPTLAGNTSLFKGYTIDIPFQKGINPRKIDIKIRSNIFPNEIRPHKLTSPEVLNGFSIFFHYPKQDSSRKQFFKADWPVRSESASKSYVMKFEIKDIEVIKNRDKWTHNGKK